ncbi:MAG: hypothetical protein NVSMB23_29350 [Myxococcales bacterium]
MNRSAVHRIVAARIVPAALAFCACAQVDLQSGVDGGVPAALRVADVQPPPGPVAASSRFQVVFSAPMDASLLLADADHSDTVVLVAPANVELVAAALAHGRLSSRVRAALVPAHAALDPPGQALELVPDQPLAAGEWWLLVASRLKDAQGRKLSGNGARFGFTVGPAPAQPRLLSPPAGASAPSNLARVRVEVPAGEGGGTLSLQGPGGAIWSGPVQPDAGTMLLQLCPEGADCAVLRPLASYGLGFNGAAVTGQTFTVAGCRQEIPPVVGSVAAIPRDDSVKCAAALATPAQVRLEVAPASLAHGTDDAAALEALCSRGACASAEGATSCTREACATAPGPDGGTGVDCPVEVSVGGLRPGTGYLFRLRASDDEGHRTLSPTGRFTTLASLPRALISEVMAWPPPPAPRANGQYVEILNAGSAPVDLGLLALVGPDGRPRPLDAGGGASVVLAPGRRALAVGSAFEAARYPALPRDLPILRANTQRLLGRGLREASPHPFALVLVRPGVDPVVLDSFPGGTHCPAGQSIERLAPDPTAKSFACGAPGGSPGAPP